MAGKRRIFSKEFKAELVKLILDGGQTAAEVSKNHGIASSIISTWVKQGSVDAGRGPAGALTTEERHELVVLRRENRELKMQRDFLKKTSAWFASQNL